MSTTYRFAGPKYATQGIMSQVPIELQVFLWQLVESRVNVHNADYLQVFKLSIEPSDIGVRQKVVHSQEEPVLVSEHYHPTLSNYQGKIFVIDDNTHCTMLLAHEY